MTTQERFSPDTPEYQAFNRKRDAEIDSRIDDECEGRFTRVEENETTGIFTYRGVYRIAPTPWSEGAFRKVFRCLDLNQITLDLSGLELINSAGETQIHRVLTAIRLNGSAEVRILHGSDNSISWRLSMNVRRTWPEALQQRLVLAPHPAM